MSRYVLLALAVALASAAPAMARFFPWRETSTQMYIDVHGQPQPRYQIRTVKHITGACLAIVSDAQTGVFAVTSVSDSVC